MGGAGPACGGAAPVGDGRAALAQILQDAQHLLGDARRLPLIRAPAPLHHLRQRPPLRKLLRRAIGSTCYCRTACQW